MLKLKKVQILGFKSFCDRTEVQLSGEGIAAVVGPNGCGKSNISDAITWVLGEQSAKSLRGVKMEDVIFAGTRERKPTGMAEVSLTLVDPEVYDGVALPDGEVEAGDWSSDGSTERALEAMSDWDEGRAAGDAGGGDRRCRGGGPAGGGAGGRGGLRPRSRAQKTPPRPPMSGLALKRARRRMWSRDRPKRRHRAWC